MKKKFKLLTLALVFLMSFGALFGCGRTPGNGPVSSGNGIGGSIRVWTVAPLLASYKTQLKYYPDDKQALFTKRVIEGFQNKYADKNVEVQLINSSWGVDLNKDLAMGIAGNTLPDIVCGEQFVRTYVVNNHFAKLEFEEDFEILPQAESVGKMGSTWYALPVWTGTLSLCVNKNVLREAGVIDEMNGDAVTTEFLNAVTAAPYHRGSDIDPISPATWEDVLAISRYIKAYYTAKSEQYKGGILLSNTKDGSAWRALGYIRTAGGEMADSNEQVMLADEKYLDSNVKALNMMRSLAETTPADSLSLINEDLIWDQFLKNKAAYIVDGIDIITHSTRDDYLNYLNPGDIVSAELPVYEADGRRSNVLIGSVYYSITNNCKNYDTALAFLEYLMSEEVQVDVMEYDMRIPCRMDVLEGEAIKQVSTYSAMQSFLQPIVNEAYVFRGGAPSFSTKGGDVSKIWETWNSAINKVLRGTDDIAAVLQEAHTAIRSYQ